MGTDDDRAVWTSLVLLERFRSEDDLAAAELFGGSGDADRESPPKRMTCPAKPDHHRFQSLLSTRVCVATAGSLEASGDVINLREMEPLTP